MKQITITILLCMCVQICMAQQNDIESEYQKRVEAMWEKHNRKRERMLKTYEEKRQKLLEEHEAFRRRVMSMWGEEELVESTKKEWVEYSDDLSSRSIVDFENGNVTIEVIADPNENDSEIDKKIEEAVDNLMDSKGKNIDFKSEVIEQKDVCTEPILQDQLDLDQQKEPEKVIEDIYTDNGKKKRISIHLELVPDHIRIRAEKYQDVIHQHAVRFNVSEPLIYAIIEQESFFNYKAKSSAGAYGLMQIVPESGGLDANRYVHGRDEKPEPEYLYDPHNNVELGTGYLKKQMEVYFKGVTDPQCRMLCAIAAYNTGQNNVYYTFTGRRVVNGAFKEINKYNFDTLYEHLKKNLPHSETRNYIVEVIKKMKKYTKQ